MSRPIISVIVPVYNPGEYFDKCVQSLISQSYQDIEIVLVDDGSNDGSSKKCDEFADMDSRIRVVHKSNGGASSARNVGIDVASGEYIGFVDSDDTVDSDMYEVMLNDIMKYNADSARCGIDRISDSGDVKSWSSGIEDVRIVNTKQLLEDIGAAEGILPVSPCNKLFKRECIGENRFDERFRFAEDTLFNFVVAKNIKIMVYHDVDRYHYRFNSNSQTSKDINDNNFDEHRVMDVIFDISDEETLPYCIKGDVLKSFRTIRQIVSSGKYNERFNDIRKRIINNKKDIFFSSIYSRKTKLKTLLLWISPNVYRIVVKKYSKEKYNK